MGHSSRLGELEDVLHQPVLALLEGLDVLVPRVERLARCGAALDLAAGLGSQHDGLSSVDVELDDAGPLAGDEPPDVAQGRLGDLLR